MNFEPMVAVDRSAKGAVPVNISGDQSAIFARQTPVNFAVTIAVVLLLTTILWPATPTHWLAAWAGLQCLLASVVFYRWWHRRHRPPSGRVSTRGLSRASMWAGFSGALWGASTLFLPHVPQLQQMAILLVLGGMAAGATTTLAAVPRAARLFILGSTLPVLIYFVAQNQALYYDLAAMVMVFIIAMISTTGVVHASMVAHLDARREAEAERAKNATQLREFERLRREWLEIAGSAEAFALFGADDRLLLWNGNFQRVLSLPDQVLFRGTDRQKVLAAANAPVDVANGLSTPEQWVSKLLSLHERARQPVIEQLQNGLWLQITARRSAVGQTVMVLVDITERKTVEESLRRSEERLAGAQHIAGLGISERDLRSGELVWSDELYHILGLEPRAVAPDLAFFESRIHPGDLERVRVATARGLREQRFDDIEFRLINQAGEERVIRAVGEIAVDASGTARRATSTYIDITDLRKAEAQLVQAQKLETVGLLTGGISHDFNNLLAVMMGNLELAEEALDAGEEARGFVRRAFGAGTRGAELTRRLLAFSRKQELSPDATDVGKLVSGMMRLLSRTIGENIEIETQNDENLPPCFVDRSQLDNALTNLVVNARDAMPDGGRLVIRTGMVEVTGNEAGGQLEAGRYVTLAVRDNGCGMPREVRERAIEPFFTTKALGHGSGLGLSMIYGFAKQSRGDLTISSIEGKGTTVTLFLPVAEAVAAAVPSEEQPSRDRPGGGEHILVVEDEPGLREVVVDNLLSLGYLVVAAEDGPTALKILNQSDNIDLLFTDIVLPNGMSGQDIAARVEALHPSAKILYTSGYTQQIIDRQMELAGDILLLKKPYRKFELAQVVRKALDS